MLKLPGAPLPTSHSHSVDHAHSHSDAAAPASYADVVSYGATSAADGHAHGGAESHGHSHDEASHGGHGAEASAHGGSGGGHSHGSMNMQGVFLHVLGDALGNVGVIASGLIIALLDTPYRFYSDPLISFIITVIIFSSALPLGACQLWSDTVPLQSD
jgi:zinc transporter 1